MTSMAQDKIPSSSWIYFIISFLCIKLCFKERKRRKIQLLLSVPACSMLKKKFRVNLGLQPEASRSVRPPCVYTCLSSSSSTPHIFTCSKQKAWFYGATQLAVCYHTHIKMNFSCHFLPRSLHLINCGLRANRDEDGGNQLSCSNGHLHETLRFSEP